MKTILLCIISLSIANVCFGFDDADTHPRLTKLAVSNSNLDNVLKNNLGITEGFNKLFKNAASGETYSAFDWLWKGSTSEDSPLCRASNHFHNPLKSWSISGGNDFPLISLWCSGSEYNFQYSNVRWATGYLSPTDSSWEVAVNKWDWPDARRYYLSALTGSDKNDRENNFANTFKALGQIMHLLEDVGVPAHTRNDFWAHLYWQGISGPPSSWLGNPFEHYVKLNYGLVSGISDATVKSIAQSVATSNIPVTRFWDTEQYNEGGNPSTSLSLGLAEYTNANFASNFTIFTEDFSRDAPHYFPYPRRDSTEEYQQEIVPGERRIYFRKNRDGENIEHFAVANRFYRFLSWWPSAQREFLTLDDNSHADYADKLLPKAAGYSAGLLNYFFRGEMDMREDPQSPGQYVLENKTGEIMKGTFELYYDVEQDDNQVNRKKLDAVYWPLDGQEIELAASGDNSKRTGITFNASSPKPKGDKYILVFQGKLGNEEGAVVGKIVDLSPIWEPWDTGDYAITRSDTQYWNEETFKVYDEWFTLATSKHTWSGVWQAWASPDTNIRVEDGHLKADVYVGGFSDGYYKSRADGGIYTTDFNGDASISGSKLKINMPSVTTNNLGDFTIYVSMSNGLNHWSQPYRVAEATSPVGLGWDTISIWVNAGLIERDLEADLRRGVEIQSREFWWTYGTSDEYIGDISQWHVTSLYLIYNFFNRLNTHFSFSIDYIDFK